MEPVVTKKRMVFEEASESEPSFLGQRATRGTTLFNHPLSLFPQPKSFYQNPPSVPTLFCASLLNRYRVLHPKCLALCSSEAHSTAFRFMQG
ncbi:hypothetical protein AHMF7605_21895 [Adhaeribacter arboris]|uniref:Uncharacterized protein n=1 Tax=Adhaeribacter arboris TaxID=2072846 RepID=A0A2T2YKC0_9BACT|nr:hypothetical protein AHMF7605_21650 [Adhaeribacter arboris]PSR55964.1 hypothetical protein AHMF7605_21895 [Adhaeribacter arboris]